MTSFFRQQLERWLKSIDVKADLVLDIGGAANLVKKRVASWEVGEYIVLDNDSEGPFDKDIYITFDLNYLIDKTEGHHGAVVTALKERADVVFCLEVFEYIWRPLTAHQNIFNFLKPGGIAYLSYPTQYPLHNPPGKDYLRYTKNAIKKYLTEVGFKDWEITPRIATDGLDSLSDFYSHERMRAVKGTKEIFDIGYMVRAVK